MVTVADLVNLHAYPIQDIESPTAQEAIRQANNLGWTHFVLRKDVDDGLPPRNSDEIPLNRIYENDRYTVFEF